MGDLSSAYICAQNALVARMCFLLALCTARGVHWTRLLKTLHINSLMGNLGNRDPFGQRVWDFRIQFGGPPLWCGHWCGPATSHGQAHTADHGRVFPGVSP